MRLPACEVCAHQGNCAIEDAIIATESEHGVKLELCYCPQFETMEPGLLAELFEDDLDPDLFSEEDLS